MVETGANITVSAALVNAVAPAITNTLASPPTTVGTAVTSLDATATVTDGGTITYEWYSNTSASTTGGTALSVTTAKYDPSVATAGTYYYYCIVTNTNNAATGTKTATATSNVSTVTVSANEITGFSMIANVDAGAVVSPKYASADTVRAALPTSATATFGSSG